MKNLPECNNPTGNGLLIVFFLLSLTYMPFAHAEPDSIICDNGQLPTGGGGADLRVIGECTVGEGIYHYGNVNIFSIFDGNGEVETSGSLVFKDEKIHFWARSILVENKASLFAGDCKDNDKDNDDSDNDEERKCDPLGTAGGRLFIYLYGDEQSQAITCQTEQKGTVGPCGIPLEVWNTNHEKKLQLPGEVEDYFYQYTDLPAETNGGFFGRKVLAVSYGGSLGLYGKKGTTSKDKDDRNFGPSDSGTSWVRLAISLPSSHLLPRKFSWTRDTGSGSMLCKSTRRASCPQHNYPNRSAASRSERKG